MADQDVGMDVSTNFGDFWLKPSDASFSVHSNVNNFRQEVFNDVVSSVVVDLTGVKVPEKFSDSRSNLSRDICLPHFVRNDDDNGNDNDNDDAGRRTL